MNPRDNLYKNPNSVPAAPQKPEMEAGVQVNGLEQVVEMLRFADPAFRDSLLKRITQRDPKLAASLKRIIR